MINGGVSAIPAARTLLVAVLESHAPEFMSKVRLAARLFPGRFWKRCLTGGKDAIRHNE